MEPETSHKQLFDSERKLVSSYLLSPSVLAGIQLLLGLYAFATSLAVLVWDSSRGNGDGYFSFFTHLSYIGLCAYFFAAGVQTFVYSVRGGHAAEYPLQRWPRVLQYLHVLLFSTIATFPFVVTIVFWALLSSPNTFSSPYSTWSNISQHALNAVFALLEIVFTNVGPLPWIDLPATIVLLGCYLGVAYITFQTQGFYPYSFLNPKQQGSLLAAYIIGIAVGQCMVFVIVRYLIILRERLVRRRMGATVVEKS
ncbi:hypothetical protein BDQ12DRAFT_629891 [Crucibulum laeve]|uniref:FAR-17a/AIG1-like protein n=1 Tax=Crucibulum laeve TaxID=68775 RepID=A0A5C3M3H7_9AGAR|nr:hypothetical protein BDQ12DRAFT_629891 [Crucibulum laeve]